MATEKKTLDPALQRHTRLVRNVEANLKLVLPDTAIEDLRFRTALLFSAGAEAKHMNDTLVTRLYEAVCAIEFAKEDVREFRTRIQRVLGKRLQLKSRPATTPNPAN